MIVEVDMQQWIKENKTVTLYRNMILMGNSKGEKKCYKYLQSMTK